MSRHVHITAATPVPLLSPLLTTPEQAANLLIIVSTPDRFLQSVPADTDTSAVANTLNNLRAAERTKVAFCPSLSHFRAYLATIPPVEQPALKGESILAVWGLVEAHWDEDWNAQGLGRTVAAVVDAATRSGKRLVLGDGVVEERGWAEAEMPLLRGMVAGVGAEVMEGRRIKVRRVLERWLRVESHRTAGEAPGEESEAPGRREELGSGEEEP